MMDRVHGREQRALHGHDSFLYSLSPQIWMFSFKYQYKNTRVVGIATNGSCSWHFMSSVAIQVTGQMKCHEQRSLYGDDFLSVYFSQVLENCLLQMDGVHGIPCILQFDIINNNIRYIECHEQASLYRSPYRSILIQETNHNGSPGEEMNSFSLFSIHTLPIFYCSIRHCNLQYSFTIYILTFLSPYDPHQGRK